MKGEGNKKRENRQLNRLMCNINCVDFIVKNKDLKRVLWYNFLIGLSRGLGMAVGFTVLGALVVYILQRIVVLNLPLISKFIADIIELVKLYGK